MKSMAEQPSVSLEFQVISTSSQISTIDKQVNLKITASYRQNLVSKQLLPLFQLLRIMGRCPLIFQLSLKHHYYSAQEKFINSDQEDLSFITNEVVAYKFLDGTATSFSLVLWNLLIVAYLIFGLFQFGALDMQIIPPDDAWPDKVAYKNNPNAINISPVSTIMLRSFELIFVLQAILDYFMALWSAPVLSKWLNAWEKIETGLDSFELLSNHQRPRFSGINTRRTLQRFILLPSILFASLVIGTDFDPSYFMASCADLVYTFISISCSFAEDAKCLLLFKSIEISFNKMVTSVEAMCTHNPTGVAPAEIRRWQSIIYDIRQQAELCGQLLSLQQLMSLLISIHFVSSALYVFVTLIQTTVLDREYILIMFSVVSLALLTVGKILLKVQMAVRITEEEKRFTECIRKLNFTENRPDCKVELRSIDNLLTDHPTQISLNNYVKLNNSLILGILGQVCTIFIVFMQLENNK
ncbi:uncharacterized protein LOC118434228 [Folsomia candida]|uniref:uncharacterized protein LOC118434228 n=1 Tax=Folsomia candida TaxID=158441 RepID=UPI001604D596|nr:uncharacterized protein LOC118434228 [Folsomia candida]